MTLLVDVISWIEGDEDVGDVLGVGTIADLDDVGVVPVSIAINRTDFDPRFAVGTSMVGSDRNNKMHDLSFQARVIVDATDAWVKGPDGSILTLTQLIEATKDAITVKRDGWDAMGVTSTDEILWSDEVERHLGVVSATYEQTEMHATYQT